MFWGYDFVLGRSVLSATAVTPVRTRNSKPSLRRWWAVVVVVASSLSLLGWFLEPAMSVPAIIAATALVGAVTLHRLLHTPEPKRLVPVGLAGNLAVRLKGQSLMVGRLPCCDVELPLPTVSSHHCRLVHLGSRWYIEDLASRNGTLVNGKPIRRARLRVGNEIQIGEFFFRVQ